MRATWLGRRDARERLLLGGFGLAVAALLYAVLVWQPATSARPVATVAAARAPTLTENAMTPVAASAAAARLPIRRIAAQGAEVRVVMENVGFDRAVAWLAALDRDGTAVTTIDVTRRADPGRVDVDVTLRRTGG